MWIILLIPQMSSCLLITFYPHLLYMSFILLVTHTPHLRHPKTEGSFKSIYPPKMGEGGSIYPLYGGGTPRIPPPYMTFWQSKRGDNPVCKVWTKKFWKKFLGKFGFIYSPMYNVYNVIRVGGGFNELLQSIYLRNLVYNFPYISYSNLRVL